MTHESWNCSWSHDFPWIQKRAIQPSGPVSCVALLCHWHWVVRNLCLLQMPPSACKTGINTMTWSSHKTMQSFFHDRPREAFSWLSHSLIGTKRFHLLGLSYVDFPTWRAISDALFARSKVEVSFIFLHHLWKFWVNLVCNIANLQLLTYLKWFLWHKLEWITR